MLYKHYHRDGDVYACVKLLGNQQMFGRIQEENCGSLYMSVQYNGDLSLLTVRLARAQDLVPREGQAGLDPYCRLRLLPDRRHQLHSKVTHQLELLHWTSSSILVRQTLCCKVEFHFINSFKKQNTTPSHRKRTKFFLSELRQNSTKCNNCF